GSFPGNLRLVLVLRPTALLQRTLSDILFKFNKDEFKMKVPVIMLSSVTELHSYIERSQLTRELGGTQAYSHDQWISHRTVTAQLQQVCDKLATFSEAARWCDEGIYLLASQPVDRCQSHEGAQAALQDLEQYLGTAGQNLLADHSAVCTRYETVLTQELRDQVEKVLQKQSSMQEMFDKRSISLKKLAAKQTRPVQRAYDSES
ncbi:hypothetical protein CRUP_006425, partial [Coryphaenoides rupestris]